MIIRFSGDDLKIYTLSSVFRYTFISLWKYVFARTEPKYSQKNIRANNNYHDNERILRNRSKFDPCRVGNRKTLRVFQTDTALIVTAGLKEEGKQARCQILALCTGQLLSAHLNPHLPHRGTHYWTAGLQGYTKHPTKYNKQSTDREAPSHQKGRHFLVSAPNWLQEQASSFPVS